MVRKILLATSNKNKLLEVASIFDDLKVLGISIKTEEKNRNLFLNAKEKLDKALSCLKKEKLKFPVIAEDTGIFIYGNYGVLGAFTKRVGRSDKERINFVINKCAGKRVLFVTVAVSFYRNRYYFGVGKLLGKIIDVPRGKNGFGYDPVFYLEDFGKTLAELSFKEKVLISHRTRALKKLMLHLIQNN